MKNLLTTLVLILVLGITSCSPIYYVPTTQNVHLISEKGEGSVAISSSSLSITNVEFQGTYGINNMEFQGAYGITKNIAIKANGHLYSDSIDISTGGLWGNRYRGTGAVKSLEIGVGYFKPITEKWILETYGICGFGKFEQHYFESSKDYWFFPTKYYQINQNISANILKLGIQPSFGYKSKYFSAAISARILNVSYHKIDGDFIFEGESQSSYLEKNASNFLIEPGITLKAGLENVKLQLELASSHNLANNRNKNQIDSYMGVGINFTFK